MEKIASDLKASETKQRSLGKTYESLHSQASSMLVLSIQWKDLQEHFDSTRNAIRTCFEELREREKMLEAKELKFKSEMESKTDELCGVQKLVDEKVQEVIELKRSIQKHSQEIEREEKRVLDVQKLVVDKERECGVVERRIQERTKKLNWVERRIEEKLNEVESKEKELNKYREDIKVKMEQLGVIDETIVEGKEKIESKEEEIKAAQMLFEECERRIKSKEEKLSWIEKSIEDTSKLANLKEEEVRVIQGSLNVYRESIKSKEGELDAILESIEGKKREFDVKEDQIKTLQRLIEGCEKELKSKEEKLKEETLKVKEYSLRNRPMEEWSCKLELKEREVELKEKQVESKMEEFKKWVEERGKELNSLSSELKVKEGQLQQEAKDLELAKKQCGVVAQVNKAIVPSSASDQSNINFTDGRNLQQFMYEHMKRNDSMSNKISSILQQESSEPGKLVLDAMQGFYPSNTTVENNEFDLVLIRRTCILLLEELKRASPQINPELIEEAMKLASDWKAKMKVGSENWLEILGFLRLVTTYELTSAYDRKELQSLFDVVAQHEQAMELFRALGTTYKAPEMEQTAAELEEIAEAKQRSLGAAFEAAKSQASSIIKFTLEWKDLEDHLESTRTALKTGFEELDGRVSEAAEIEAEAERLMAVAERRWKEAEDDRVREVAEIEAKAESLTAEMERRRKEAEEGEGYLESVRDLIRENDEELRVREERYGSLERLIREKEREVEEVDRHVKEKTRKLNWVEKRTEVKGKEVEDEVKRLVEERKKELIMVNKELEGKVEMLRFVEESIAECCRELEIKEGAIRAADAKGEEFCVLKRAMEEWCCNVEVKEREMEGLVARMESKEKEVESKVEELGLIRKEFLDEVQLKERHLDLLEKSLLEREEKWHLVQKSVEECSRGSVITRDGIGLQLFMDEHLKRIDSMGTELSAILKESSDPAKLVLDAMQGFYPENRGSDFELRVRRRSCCLLLEELMRMSPQMNPQVKEEARKVATDWKAKMTVASDNDYEVLGFLRLVAAYGLTSTYDAKELKRLLSNVSHGQQAAELGLALGITAHGSHICTPVKIEEPESSAANNAATVSSPNPQSNATRDARNSQLPVSSAANNTVPISSPNPQSSATTDARNFQGSINEHLSWNLDEIHNELVASVRKAPDPGKLVLMLMQKSLVKYWTSAEASLKKGAMSCNISLLKMLMRVSPQVGSHVKEDAKKLGLQWKENIRAAEHLENHLEIAGFLLFVVTYGLISTLNGDEIVKLLERLSQHKEAFESLLMHGFLDKILVVFIQTLVEGKQLFQALGFVFKFKLLGNFTPVRVLKDYVKDVNLSETLKRKNSADEKFEFIDSRIADLRAVLRCIKEYNLESEYPSGEIEVQIVELEKLKEICRGPEKCLASVIRQQEQSQGQKRSSSSSPAVQQGQQKSKFHRTAEASPSPYKSPSFTPVQLQSRVTRPPSSLAYGNYGQQGQVGNMAANCSEVDGSSSLAYGNYGRHGRVGDMAANSVQVDRFSSLASGIHRQRGQFGNMAANLPEVNPHFGIIDEVDPLFGVPNLPNPHPLMDFTPFPRRYGPF